MIYRFQGIYWKSIFKRFDLDLGLLNMVALIIDCETTLIQRILDTRVFEPRGTTATEVFETVSRKMMRMAGNLIGGFPPAGCHSLLSYRNDLVFLDPPGCIDRYDITEF